MVWIDSLGKLLGYGISGLGLALAILAFKLLNTEQKITKPRSTIITAIYAFMGFSLLLTAGGLAFELKRLANEAAKESRQPSLAPLPNDAPDQLWYDVLKATRQRIFGNAPSREYIRGVLTTAQTENFAMEIQGGACRGYMVMTKPPAQIEVAVNSPQEITHTPLGREHHLAFGRICAAKTPTSANVTLRVTMASGSGPFVAESYQAQ